MADPLSTALTGFSGGVLFGYFVVPTFARVAVAGLEGLADWCLGRGESTSDDEVDRQPTLVVFSGSDRRCLTPEHLGEFDRAFYRDPDHVDLLEGVVGPDGSISNVTVTRSAHGRTWHSMADGHPVDLDPADKGAVKLAENSPRVQGHPGLWVASGVTLNAALRAYREALGESVGLPPELQTWLDQVCPEM